MDVFVIYIVRSQPVGLSCRASINCTGGPGDDLGNTTEDECCVENSRGLAYATWNGSCITCIDECL